MNDVITNFESFREHLNVSSRLNADATPLGGYVGEEAVALAFNFMNDVEIEQAEHVDFDLSTTDVFSTEQQQETTGRRIQVARAINTVMQNLRAGNHDYISLFHVLEVDHKSHYQEPAENGAPSDAQLKYSMFNELVFLIKH